MSLCKMDHRFLIRWERRREGRWYNRRWVWFKVLYCACCDLRIEEP